MTPDIFLDGKVSQYCGDVLTVLRTLPDNHFDCVVTSPPYWGLRDYGTGRWEGGDAACAHDRVNTERTAWANSVKGPGNLGKNGNTYANMTKIVGGHCSKCEAQWIDNQIGLERSLGEHLTVMVEVFAEVRRVLKTGGTLWLNYGDCYATSPNGRSAADTKALDVDDRTFRDKPFSTIGPIAGGYLKAGDLCMVPNRIAIALQDAGWWVKAENIWGKPNGMPDSSGVYRPSTSHEKIWLLAKSDESGWYRARDTGEMTESPDLTERVPMVTTGELGARWIRMPFYYNAAAVRRAPAPASIQRWSQDVSSQKGSTRAVGKTNGTMKAVGRPKVDNQRGHSRRHHGFNDRWDQMERGEQVADGRLVRNYEIAPVSVWPMATSSFSEAHFATFPVELAERCIVAGCPPGGRVLDIFGGSGTVAIAALAQGRTAALIDLNPEYCTLARARIEAAFMGKDEGARHMVKQLGKAVDAGPLFAAVESGSSGCAS